MAPNKVLGTKHYQFSNLDFWCKRDTWDVQKRHIISPGSQTELQDISSSKKPWINVFSGPKTSKMPLSSWDTGVQKLNERKSQNSILSLPRAFFHCQKLKPISKMNWNKLHHWFWHFPYQFCSITIFTRMPLMGDILSNDNTMFRMNERKVNYTVFIHYSYNIQYTICSIQ